MGIEGRIRELISPSVEDLGYEVVRVLVSGRTRPTVQIMVERRDGTAITLEDCGAVSRAVSALLDVEDPIAGAYVLEVSSPGIDRPLIRRQDYERFAGFEARIEMAMPIAGQRRFKGRLLGLAGEEVRLAVGEAEVRLPLGEVRRAKLVLSDELFAAAKG
ncbi:MAG: ribosome maturation factor RimP [Proteobacteria bacterium]|nr:ribosome maturation factor RimP [Pseudomonadota bacterium]